MVRKLTNTTTNMTLNKLSEACLWKWASEKLQLMSYKVKEVELPKIEQEDPIPDVDSCCSSHLW